MILQSIAKVTTESTSIYIGYANTNWQSLGFNAPETRYITEQIKNENPLISINRYDSLSLIAIAKVAKTNTQNLEAHRIAGAETSKQLNLLKIKTATLQNTLGSDKTAESLAFAEGMLLANYQFLKYKKDAAKEKNSFETLNIHLNTAKENKVTELLHLTEAVYAARNLVNEPLSYLTAEQMSEEIQLLGKIADFKVKVFNKKKIQQLKMGGLLAVNAGSQDPPTFSILEWKPKNASNKQPIILVGKGVVYDTGGLSLKPTANSMDFMKCDMGGAAAVIGAIYAAAKNKLPLHIIGLVPATDNRPGENAYVPGDVITMHSGLTVEVLNTDAEGRMILADALSYAQQYDPELVIDIATLTGSAVMAIGSQGMLLMGNADENTKQNIKTVGYQVHERLVEMPLWEEYNEQIKSDIADIKNVGGKTAGAITAAMFLQNFTKYPWLHIDAASMAWNHGKHPYQLKNGTGAGVRLLYGFLKNRANQE